MLLQAKMTLEVTDDKGRTRKMEFEFDGMTWGYADGFFEPAPTDDGVYLTQLELKGEPYELSPGHMHTPFTLSFLADPAAPTKDEYVIRAPESVLGWPDPREL